MRWRVLVVALGCLLAASGGVRAQQTAPRRPATIEALRRFPGYFHLQPIVLRGEFAETGGHTTFRADERQIDVMLADDVRTTGGAVELRGELIDVGRLEPGDSRLTGYAGARDADRWPKPGEELLIRVTGVRASEPATNPTVRALALEPWRFDGQTVTLTGQFRGRNLFGDLPGAPAQSRYDFVLRSADGAVWVTGLRPKGKGFDLDVDARVDTNRWVSVTGLVKRERSLVTIAATRIEAASPRAEAAPEEAPEEAPVATAPSLPIEVVFSAPSDTETEVAAAATVRVQFSRGLAPASVAQGFTVALTGGAPDTVPPAFRATYDAATRSVELRFTTPLPPFRTVRVSTTDILRGFDGSLVTPWAITFSTGG